MEMLLTAYGEDDPEEEADSTAAASLRHRINRTQCTDSLLSDPYLNPNPNSRSGFPSEGPLSPWVPKPGTDRGSFAVSKRHRPSSPPVVVTAGRYVSKREKLAAAQLGPPPPSQLPCKQTQVKVLDSEMPWSLKKQTIMDARRGGHSNQLPKGIILKLKAHKKPVTALRWSPTNGSLLVSAGMDVAAHVWNVWNKGSAPEPVRTFSHHTSAIKDAQWSPDGTCVLTCGFDQTSRLVDVESGSEIQVFKEDQFINVVKFHPINKDEFLSGGSKGSLKLWDIRTGGMVLQYHNSLGQVMDVDFNREGKRFVSASDVADENVSEKAIIVWDFATQVPLSNQVYLEAYTCSCVRYHPWEDIFLGQTNGSYIAMFSGCAPFRMNKYKRFEGHQVCGYRIQCNFSPDGGLVVSGSSDGRVFLYQYATTKLLKVLEAHPIVCVDVSYHPTLPSVLASGGWEGDICIFS